MAGYAFAKLRFSGREQIFRSLLGAIVIPAQVAMLPLFLLLKNMGLVNTYAGVLVPALATIFGIALVRQYALSIPDEMLEAARVDGASEFRIFASIVVPALRPILATLATFTFLGTWNDFMWPLIILSDEKSLYSACRTGLAVARARARQRAHDGRRGRNHSARAVALSRAAAAVS